MLSVTTSIDPIQSVHPIQSHALALADKATRLAKAKIPYQFWSLAKVHKAEAEAEAEVTKGKAEESTDKSSTVTHDATKQSTGVAHMQIAVMSQLGPPVRHR